jgi:hypothetical protein
MASATAKVIPSGWRELEGAGPALRQIETFAIFEAGLPEAMTVFRSCVQRTACRARLRICGFFLRPRPN